MGGKVGTTVTVAGMIAALLFGGALLDRLPSLTSILSSTADMASQDRGDSDVSNRTSSRPSGQAALKFSVSYNREPEQAFAPSECGPSVGGGCRYDVPTQRM
jgi:hypothetical protein